MTGRRRTGLAVSLSAAAVLVGWLAYMAWGPNENSSHPPLPFGDGLESIAVLCVPCAPFLVAAGAVAASELKAVVRAILTAVLLGVVGCIGFVGSIAIYMSRCDTCDDA